MTPEVGYVSHVNRGTEHIADTWPPIPRQRGAAPTAAEKGEELANLLKTQPHLKEKGIPIWLAHLPPEMKEKIRKAGLPLLSLLGLGYMQPDQSVEAR